MRADWTPPKAPWKFCLSESYLENSFRQEQLAAQKEYVADRLLQGRRPRFCSWLAYWKDKLRAARLAEATPPARISGLRGPFDVIVEIADALAIVDVDGESMIASTAGDGVVLGPLNENYKQHAARIETSLVALDPERYSDAALDTDADLVYRQYLCPVTGMLLRNELTLRDAPPVWDMRVDPTSLYERSPMSNASIAVTHRTIAANEYRIAIREAGSGPLVLMLHDFPETAYSYPGRGPTSSRRCSAPACRSAAGTRCRGPERRPPGCGRATCAGRLPDQAGSPTRTTSRVPAPAPRRPSATRGSSSPVASTASQPRGRLGAVGT